MPHARVSQIDIGASRGPLYSIEKGAEYFLDGAKRILLLWGEHELDLLSRLDADTVSGECCTPQEWRGTNLISLRNVYRIVFDWIVRRISGKFHHDCSLLISFVGRVQNIMI
jgi:hypothetical protein